MASKKEKEPKQKLENSPNKTFKPIIWLIIVSLLIAYFVPNLYK